MFRRLLSIGCFCVAVSALVPKADAAFVFFNVPGLHAGERARVAEQIVCANFACTVLDYQFYLANTGVVGIDGFALGLGAVPGVLPLGNTSFATAGGGGDGPFPAQPFGGQANGGTGVLGPCGPLACNPAAYGPAAWGFEEFQDGNFGGLPPTYYLVRWYSPIQGPFGAKLLPGRYTRLDLITVYPPAGGSGAVDPLSGAYLGFDSVGDGVNFGPEFNIDGDLTGTNDPGDAWGQPCDPATQSCGTPATDPTSDSVFANDTSDLVQSPEPVTFALMGGALVGLGVLRRKRA